ncbi:glyoxalase/bleomycin resistance/extradiol dioxygenase family protein [Cytophagaceae bacterium DM2B3-1]|uniref:Glyoxalase/bleomycin resistance/extradiol dioxygenase family protein n=1 Tax=Xanthocytophaga flava TaxID=3048013 RepID=A0ABT7CQN0_9BACT|nr:glyoxalase/bleomycin resistance/extradiol dioxygenase family protein [Xanthocytophaga flavus]MDJ1496048.1 glyoxalase/bleomycin resistance/extradiol dioxygenase family protein [Xanthocytophaga flavus]
MEFRTIIIRSSNISVVADFYSKLGLVFEYHQHGNGAFHYASTLKNIIFEIYPLLKGQTTADTSTRLGIAIDNFDTVLTTFSPEQILKAPHLTEWGELAIVQDPDGRKIEIYRT